MANAQRTDGWKAERAGLLTASKFGAAMGLSPYQSRASLWRELTGRQTPDVFEPAVTWGTDHEPTAISAYEEETGYLVEAVGFIKHPKHNYLGASPDGLVKPDGSIEAKCPFSDKPLPDVPPQHYLAQAYGVMECADRAWLDFIYWTEAEMRIWRIDRNRILWSEIMLPKLAGFWTFLEEDKEPPRMKKSDGVVIPFYGKPRIVRFAPKGETVYPF